MSAWRDARGNAIRWAVLIAGVLAAWSPAAAQVRHRPTRATGEGVFGGGQALAPPTTARTERRLWLNVDFVGSYDRFTQTGGLPAGEGGLQLLPDRSVGLVDASLDYQLGNVSRWLQVSGSGFVAAYDIGGRLAGGEGSAAASTYLGRRNRLNVSQTVRNAPYFSLGEFGSLSGVVGPGVLPDSDPTLALGERRSTTLSSLASLTRDWTTRQSTRFGYTYSRSDFDDDALGNDSRGQAANVEHSWQFRRTAAFQLEYGAHRLEHPAASHGGLVGHGLTTGFNITRRLSPTRQIQFGARAGAMYSEFLNHGVDEQRWRWFPSAAGSMRLDVGRSWGISGDYSRTATVLDQLVLQTFYSDTFAVTAGGLIGRRLDATVTAGTARGRTPAGVEETGAYESYTISTQLRVAVARWCAAVVSYSYYDYRIRGIAIPESFPDRSRMNGLRVGMSFWLPIYNSRREAPSQR